MMISDSQFDTKPLASMNDIDLRPGCPMPPPVPSDPESLTDTSYATCKLALATEVRKIISSLFGITPPSYDEIMKFDTRVRQVYDSFPSVMKHSLTNRNRREEGIILRVQRLGLQVITNHTLLILHRPFLYRSFHDAKYIPSREKCLEAAHQVLELFHEFRNNLDNTEYSWYALGALHAFHAGTVVALRCYLEPLTCDERHWNAVDKAMLEFEIIGKVDGWGKLGEKATKVFGILIRKALERKAMLEGVLGTSGVTIGVNGGQQQPQSQPSLKFENAIGYDVNMPFSVPALDNGSTGFTPQFSGSLFGTPNQFDLNPLTNPNIRQESFNSAGLQGAGMPGVVNSDSSPDQASWDAFWPKGMNLV